MTGTAVSLEADVAESLVGHPLKGGSPCKPRKNIFSFFNI